MGKRCRQAAWGATFALLVAACAATDSTTNRSSANADNSAAAPAIDQSIPDSLANASITGTGDNAQCATGASGELALHETTTGDQLWSIDVPHPAGRTVLHDDVVYMAFSWTEDHAPGVAAIDLATQAIRWRRVFDDEPEQLVVVGRSLIVVTRDSIRGVDLVSGEDSWLIGNEFVFTEAIIEGNWAYAIDNVAVHGINLRTGELTWQLPIERPDELAAREGLLAVAARNRIIAVDTTNQTFLWDQPVNRLGSGNMWIGTGAVIVELAPAESPSGGLAALDRVSGVERWRLESVDAVHWPSADQLLTTIASTQFRGSQPFDLLAIDVGTGVPEWSIATTVDSTAGVLSVTDGRVLFHEPHPAVAGASRMRLIDTTTGSVLWEAPSVDTIDGARIEGDLFVSAYHTSDDVGAARGHGTMILGPGRSWTIDTEEGIQQDLRLADAGVVVLSGERNAVCLGRELVDPESSAAALSLRAG